MNDVLDFNNQYKVDDINEQSNGKLNKNDLNDNKINNFNPNNYKTQGQQKTYSYLKNNKDVPDLTYNYNSVNKIHPHMDINLENEDDEDQIKTFVTQNIYGASRTKKNEDKK